MRVEPTGWPHIIEPDAPGGYDWTEIDRALVREAVAEQGKRETSGIGNIVGYLARQVSDHSHRKVLGPLTAGTGASGLVVHRGWVIGGWGDCTAVEMCFSVTKSVVSTIAGLAFDRGLLPNLHAPVATTVDHPAFTDPWSRRISWHHLLQQTSQWGGKLWGKPTWIDAQDSGTTAGRAGGLPGSGWAYNDVRVNLLCLALTVLLRRSLPTVLREELLDPLGASAGWSWHGYPDAAVRVDRRLVPVVSGGAHWGGGLWMSANDLALLGVLYLHRGRWGQRQLLSEQWIDLAWRPCELRPDYGYLWWLNDSQRVFPAAPATGRCARGNSGRHLLWIDPARDLVIVSHWGENVADLISAVSEAVPAA